MDKTIIERAVCFPPVYDERSKVLFLGTIPSKGSVKHGFYYLGAGNAFWELLSKVADFDFLSLAENCKSAKCEDQSKTAKDRLIAALLTKNIALYDTIGDSFRHGSRDDQIDSYVLQNRGDVLKIIENSSIKKIFCTSTQALNNLFKIFGGKTAANIALKKAMGLNDSEMPCEKLLSPSATAIMYGQVTPEIRLEDWQKIKKYL